MSDRGLQLVDEEEGHPQPDAVAAVRAELERASTAVKVELTRLRQQRSDINDRIRELVAQDALLDRMARVEAPKPKGEDPG